MKSIIITYILVFFVSIAYSQSGYLCDEAVELKISDSDDHFLIYSNADAPGSKYGLNLCRFKSSDKDLWFRFEMPMEGDVIVDTKKVDLEDMVIQAYSGTCSKLQYIICNDDYQGNKTARVIIPASKYKGLTIFIRVKEYYNKRGRFGIIAFLDNKAQKPKNDNCRGSVSVPIENNYKYAHTLYNTENASLSEVKSNCLKGDVIDLWYKFLPSSSSAALGIVHSRGVDYSLDAFTGSCENLRLLECGSVSRKLNGLSIKDSVYVRIVTNSYVNDSFSLKVFEVPNHISNDDCISATELELTDSTKLKVFDNFLRTITTDQPKQLLCFSDPAYDVWYKIKNPKKMDFVIKNVNIPFGLENITLEAYSGVCENLNPIACANEEKGVTTLEIRDQKEDEYTYIRVVGAAGQEGYYGLKSFPLKMLTQNRIQKIVKVSSTPCNMSNNTYSLKLAVDFTAENKDRKVLKLSKSALEFPLRDADTIEINGLASNNLPFNEVFYVFDYNTQLSGNYYYTSNLDTAPKVCFSPPPSNDQCSTAQELKTQSNPPFVYNPINLLGAKFKYDVNISSLCSKNGEDVWIKSKVLPNGELYFNVDLSDEDQIITVEAYKGNCNKLQYLNCNQLTLFRPTLSITGLVPNEYIYFRLYNSHYLAQKAVSVAITNYNSCGHDFNALIDFYQATGGSKWKNNDGWKNNENQCNYCEWKGIECNVFGRVKSIKLDDNNINGVLPNSFSKLLFLESIQMSNNVISGSFEQTIGKLPNIKVVKIDHNNFSGIIPTKFVEQNGIKSIDASFNNLNGCFPNILSEKVLSNDFIFKENPLLPYSGNLIEAALDKSSFCNDVCTDEYQSVFESRYKCEKNKRKSDCHGFEKHIYYNVNENLFVKMFGQSSLQSSFIPNNEEILVSDMFNSIGGYNQVNINKVDQHLYSNCINVNGFTQPKFDFEFIANSLGHSFVVEAITDKDKDWKTIYSSKHNVENWTSHSIDMSSIKNQKLHLRFSFNNDNNDKTNVFRFKNLYVGD